MKKLLPVLLICALAFCGCGKKYAEKSTYALNTTITMKCTQSSNITRVFDLIRTYEGCLSVTNPQSDIYRLNADMTQSVSDITSDALLRAYEMSEKTNGSFNFAIYPIVSQWGFTNGNYNVPSDEIIFSLLPDTDFTKVKINGNIVVKAEKTQLDLGGIAKGIITDKAVQLLRENGEESALLSLGGNIYAIGSKDKKPWRVAVRNPFSDGYIGTLSVCDRAVITSGSYERFFERNGVRYHHIIDPQTGKPAQSGLASVTIVSENATLADGYSTALFVMGLDKATKFWRENGGFDAIFVTDDGEIYITDGIQNSFSAEKYKIIERVAE